MITEYQSKQLEKKWNNLLIEKEKRDAKNRDD